MNREDRIELIKNWHLWAVHQFGQDEQAEAKANQKLYEAIVDNTLDTFLAEFVEAQLISNQGEIATIEREKVDGSKREIAIQEEVAKLEAIAAELPPIEEVVEKK